MPIRNSVVCAIALAFSTAPLPGCATAPKQKDVLTFQQHVRSATNSFEQSVPGLTQQIDQSGGYVVFPDVAKWGILFSGGSFGRGAVCRPDGVQVGWVAINRGSLGLQAGVQGFRALIVLENQDALQKLKSNSLTGAASSSVVIGNNGAAQVAPFKDGVIVYEDANSGLMAGVDLGLSYIRYVPLGSTTTTDVK